MWKMTLHLFFDVILLLASLYAGGSEDPAVGYILIPTYAIKLSDLRFYRNFQQNPGLI